MDTDYEGPLIHDEETDLQFHSDTNKTLERENCFVFISAVVAG
jgi:hypothetical protein